MGPRVRGDDSGHAKLSRNASAPESWVRSAPGNSEGVGNAGCSSRTRSLAWEKKNHTSKSTARSRIIPAFPHANGFTVSFVLSLVNRALLPPSPARIARSILADLTPASRRQDHTTSPSATRALVIRTCRVHRIPHPTFVTIAKRPSCGAGRGRYASDLGEARREIFFQRGLDRWNRVDPV
jgi:hypothetical protein